MAEKILEVKHNNLLELYGVSNQKIDLFNRQFPNLKVVVRGNEIKVTGEEAEINLFEEKFIDYQHYTNKNGQVSVHALAQYFEGINLDNLPKGDDTIVFGNAGLVIKARTPNQRKMLESIKKHDMLFAIGPAGSGKTYTAVALAVRALKNKEVKRIILTRPAVEAGENLGFLPGDVKEKLDPYLQPLYDALRDMLPGEKLSTYIENGTIQIAPLAFMRGRTLDHAFVILDEAQNATDIQLKMFLTRMGRTAKFVITGDITQIDLPKKQVSGLVHAERILRKVEGIDFIYLTGSDIVRHEIVRRIVEAYDAFREDK